MSLFDVEYLYWYCRSKSGCGEERKLCPFCHSVAEWQKRILDQYYWFVTLFAILVRQWSCSRFPWLFVFYCRFCFFLLVWVFESKVSSGSLFPIWRGDCGEGVFGEYLVASNVLDTLRDVPLGVFSSGV